MFYVFCYTYVAHNKSVATCIILNTVFYFMEYMWHLKFNFVFNTSEMNSR